MFVKRSLAQVGTAIWNGAVLTIFILPPLKKTRAAGLVVLHAIFRLFHITPDVKLRMSVTPQLHVEVILRGGCSASQSLSA